MIGESSMLRKGISVSSITAYEDWSRHLEVKLLMNTWPSHGPRSLKEGFNGLCMEELHLLKHIDLRTLV